MIPRALQGLGARLVAALLLVSAVSLAVAAVALLSPLERRLREERLDELTAAALGRAPSFERLAPAELRTRGARLARSLARRAGARVAVLDARGKVFATTDPDEPADLAVVRRALRERHLARGTVRREGQREARLAVPVRIGGRRLAIALRAPLEESRTAVAVVRRALRDAALIALTVALVLGLALATRLVRRLRALRDTALRVAELGPEAEMRTDSARDEVGDLTRAFATMRSRLSEQERARRRFVSTASHELRTPLASLQLMLGLLREDLSARDPDLAAARAEVARAEARTEQLSRLAEDLLDLSRIDAGVPLRQEPIELGELCRAVLAEFRARLDEQRRGVDIAAPVACWALADPTAVARIVRILLDNALKFSPPDTVVEVEVRRFEDGAAVSVRDRGPGVPTEERELIFDRFSRGRTGGDGGFGLGLAIGRELAHRMGGDLRLDEIGAGARFTVVLRPATEPGETVASAAPGSPTAP